MKISILSPDLSHNCLGRAHLLAELLDRFYEVEIVGPKFRTDIWKPVKGEYDYKEVDTGNFVHQFVPDIPDLLNIIDGDIILASKPKVQSYAIALLKRLGNEFPLVLDIDDWETGLKYNRGQLKTYVWGFPTLVNINSFYYLRVLEKLTGLADAHTVSNQFLQKKFSGEVIPHARDTNVFDPSRFNKQAAREAFGLSASDELVMFLGTPRPHKGVEDLVRAVSSLNRDDVRVVLVGAHQSEYVARLRRVGTDSLIVRGQQPFDEIPRWIAAADVIVIPQKETPATRGQTPAKVFDAMAMGKPIVATNVSDLPTILDGCGVIVKPGSVPQLAGAITELIEDEAYRRELSHRARERSIAEYSYDAVAPRLANVIESI